VLESEAFLDEELPQTRSNSQNYYRPEQSASLTGQEICATRRENRRSNRLFDESRPIFDDIDACDHCNANNSSFASGFGTSDENDSGVDGTIVFTRSENVTVREIEVFGIRKACPMVKELKRCSRRPILSNIILRQDVRCATKRLWKGKNVCSCSLVTPEAAPYFENEIVIRNRRRSAGEDHHHSFFASHQTSPCRPSQAHSQTGFAAFATRILD
jgi:hypothetical protein